ncbi:MAG: DUF1573 domain-containing protein [Fuerstiella sp.]
MTTTSSQTKSNDAVASPAFRGKTVMLVLAALSPCLASAYFSLQPPALPPLVATGSRPALVFSTYLYHHGEDPVSLDSTLRSEFRFRNDGSETVTLGKVERSCGCMNPELTARKLAPGEIGSLVVPLQTLNQSPGPHEYTLTLHYTDPEPRQTTLTIKATFPEKMVVVQPTALYMSQNTDRSIPFQISVSDFRDGALSVTGVESTAWFVSAGVNPASAPTIVQTSYVGTDDPAVAAADASTNPAGQIVPTARTTITGEVSGSIPPGRHHVLVAATTDDPEFPVVTVPMVLNGPVYPDGQAAIASPSQIALVAGADKSARRTAMVRVLMPTAWQVSHADAWPAELDVEFDEGVAVSDVQKAVTMQVRLSDIPSTRVKEGIVQLVANDSRNLVTVRVSLHYP